MELRSICVRKKSVAVKSAKNVCRSPHQTLVWWKRTEFLEFRITAESKNLILAYRATNESLVIHSFHFLIRWVASYVSYRKSKEKALVEMREIQPDTPTVATPVSDLSWTHGQWREAESSDDEITDNEPHADQTFTILQWRFDLPRKSTDRKSTLIGHVTDMVKECSCS